LGIDSAVDTSVKAGRRKHTPGSSKYNLTLRHFREQHAKNQEQERAALQFVGQLVSDDGVAVKEEDGGSGSKWQAQQALRKLGQHKGEVLELLASFQQSSTQKNSQQTRKEFLTKLQMLLLSEPKGLPEAMLAAAQTGRAAAAAAMSSAAVAAGAAVGAAIGATPPRQNMKYPAGGGGSSSKPEAQRNFSGDVGARLARLEDELKQCKRNAEISQRIGQRASQEAVQWKRQVWTVDSG
jgi:hypothetical protein